MPDDIPEEKFTVLVANLHILFAAIFIIRTNRYHPQKIQGYHP